MWNQPDLPRLRALKRLHEYPIGSAIVFCPSCDFQHEPQTVGKNACPECGTSPLHTVTASAELFRLAEDDSR